MLELDRTKANSQQQIPHPSRQPQYTQRTNDGLNDQTTNNNQTLEKCSNNCLDDRLKEEQEINDRPDDRSKQHQNNNQQTTQKPTTYLY